MSLLDSCYEAFTMMDRTTVADGYGGFTSTWKEGASFNAVAVYDDSLEARVAEVQGVTSRYVITTSKAVTLEYHDVVKRASDGKTFRVTSDSRDKQTPPTASLDMRQVTAEAWVLSGTIIEVDDNGQGESNT